MPRSGAAPQVLDKLKASGAPFPLWGPSPHFCTGASERLTSGRTPRREPCGTCAPVPVPTPQAPGTCLTLHSPTLTSTHPLSHRFTIVTHRAHTHTSPHPHGHPTVCVWATLSFFQPLKQACLGLSHTHIHAHTHAHTHSCTHRRAHTRTHGLRCSWNILRTGDSHARPLASPARPQPWSSHPAASGSLSAARTLPSSTVPATHSPPSPEEKAVSSPKPRASGLRPCVGPTLPAPSRTVSHGSSPGSAWKLLFTTSQCQPSPHSCCGTHQAPSQDCSGDVGSQVEQVPKHYLFGRPEGHPTSSTVSPHFSPPEVGDGVWAPGAQQVLPFRLTLSQS